MEVVAMAPAEPTSSSYTSAPASPRPFEEPAPLGCCRYYYTSAPTSPSRAAAAYADFYGWDEEKEKPTRPEPVGTKASSDFAFCFYGPSEGEWPMPPLATADELFEEGMIRPLMLPPRHSLHYPSAAAAAAASKSDGTRQQSSPRGGGGGEGEGFKSPVMTMREALRAVRGRVLSSSSDASCKGQRGSRSLSPFRGGGEGDRFPKSPPSSSALLIKCGDGSRKWKLKDLFLFRSASEGRATGRGSKDPLRRYTLLPSSSSSSSSSSTSSTVRGGAANCVASSAQYEMYYSANRAASEELRKKTPLPYKRHGLFGCLRFNPAIHGIKKGFAGGTLFSRK